MARYFRKRPFQFWRSFRKIKMIQTRLRNHSELISHIPLSFSYPVIHILLAITDTLEAKLSYLTGIY